MASPYDAYRLDPAPAPGAQYRTRGEPQMYYAPSDSLFGGYRQDAGVGAGPLASAIGVSMPVIGAPLAIAKSLSDTGFSRLGSVGGWKNVATFGGSDARDEQERARQRRIEAVSKWRMQNFGNLYDVLNQQGADVSADLRDPLRKAVFAGDDMLSDPEVVKTALMKFQQRADQYMLGRTRAGQARQVDAMMADPRRLADRNQRLQAERTQGLSQLAERYRLGQRNNAFNQARRGTMGSSMDVEQQGELGRARDTGAMALQSGLDEKARQYRLGDQQQANTLKGLIYADDPNTAAAFSRTLEGIGAQGKLMQEQQAVQGQMGAARSAAATGYSQAFGGLMSSASRPLGYYIEHQGSGA